jgi:hypothetical protein
MYLLSHYRGKGLSEPRRRAAVANVRLSTFFLPSLFQQRTGPKTDKPRLVAGACLLGKQVTPSQGLRWEDEQGTQPAFVLRLPPARGTGGYFLATMMSLPSVRVSVLPTTVPTFCPFSNKS